MFWEMGSNRKCNSTPELKAGAQYWAEPLTKLRTYIKYSLQMDGGVFGEAENISPHVGSSVTLHKGQTFHIYHKSPPGPKNRWRNCQHDGACVIKDAKYSYF